MLEVFQAMSGRDALYLVGEFTGGSHRCRADGAEMKIVENMRGPSITSGCVRICRLIGCHFQRSGSGASETPDDQTNLMRLSVSSFHPLLTPKEPRFCPRAVLRPSLACVRQRTDALRLRVAIGGHRRAIPRRGSTETHHSASEDRMS